MTFGKGPRVFVVDDEAIISSTLTAILKLSGFDATAFNNPVNALEAALISAPDLLLSDVVMPGLSGIDLAIQVREHCPNCKIFLISGQATTNNLIESAAEHGHRFEILPKPIHPSELIKRLNSAFDIQRP